MPGSLYIHIPFCARKCIYCDFYSVVYKNDLAAAYVDTLVAQIKGLDGPFATVYIGGGTPTVLDKGLLERLFKGLGRFLRKASEVTVEANPESVNSEKIRLLFDSGVTRLSVGVQSFLDKKLKKLGRLHDARKAAEAVRLAAKAGFGDIGIDLIFGVWGERTEEWKKDLEKIDGLPITHLSCYGLTYEKGTPLFAAVANKSVMPLEDETGASMYEHAIDYLSARGFKQYEVSNFAKGGFECRHNIGYWENDPYTGLGASAVSYKDGVRSKNMASVEGYIQAAREGKGRVESTEKLSSLLSAKETAAVKIRTKAGIDFGWFEEKTGFDFLKLEGKAVRRLADDGLIKYKKEGNAITGVRLRRKGFLFCDTVSSALL